MFRFSSLNFFAASLLLLCASCQNGDHDQPPPTDDYWRTEALQHGQLGTIRLPTGQKKVVAETDTDTRLLVDIRGKGAADYDVFGGPRKHLRDHRAPPKLKDRATLPPVIAPSPGPSTTPVITDDTPGESFIRDGFPFFELVTGWAYISGTAPAAQTKHVIAGSDSTKFIIEIDRGDGTEESMIHRVYATEGTVRVQAIENGVKVGQVIPVEPNQYIEVRYQGGWYVFGPGIYPAQTDGTLEAIDKARSDAHID